MQEHLLRRFFCCACDKTLSSFESLRTHANSQHFRNRLFKCETCSTTYLDPARLAKCRKRHRGQFRCPEIGCVYHNARKNSVVRHIKTQHHRVADEDDIPFDNHLSSAEPPKMRRVGSSSSASVPSLPGSVESLLGLPSQGPTDDELFRLSEERRRVRMELTRKEHVEWMGGEDALKAAVPDYPMWAQRDHPYGRAPSLEPELPKHDAESESPSLSSTPELVVSSPEPVDTALVPTTTGTLKAWAPHGPPPITSMSHGLLVPSNPFIMSAAGPQTPTSTTGQAWYGKGHSYSDSMLPNYTAPLLSYPIPSPTMSSDAFTIPGLERETLFSPGSSSPPLTSPEQPWLSPVTPHQDHFFNTTLFDTSSNSVYGSQYSDDAASQVSLFLTSPDPTMGSLSVLPQAHHVQDVKSECGLPIYFSDWTEATSDR